jgi:hypothetical protein
MQLTDAEQQARSLLEQALSEVQAARARLVEVLKLLPEGADDEAMAEGAKPRSLAFHFRATTECLLIDQVRPLEQDLGRAVATTPEELEELWSAQRADRQMFGQPNGEGRG